MNGCVILFYKDWRHLLIQGGWSLTTVFKNTIKTFYLSFKFPKIFLSRTVFISSIFFLLAAFLFGILGNPCITFFSVNKKMASIITQSFLFQHFFQPWKFYKCLKYFVCISFCLIICGCLTLTGIIWFTITESNSADLGVLDINVNPESIAAFWKLGWCVYLGFVFSVLNLLFSIYAFRVACSVSQEPEFTGGEQVPMKESVYI